MARLGLCKSYSGEDVEKTEGQCCPTAVSVYYIGGWESMALHRHPVIQVTMCCIHQSLCGPHRYASGTLCGAFAVAEAVPTILAAEGPFFPEPWRV